MTCLHKMGCNGVQMELENKHRCESFQAGDKMPSHSNTSEFAVVDITHTNMLTKLCKFEHNKDVIRRGFSYE